MSTDLHSTATLAAESPAHPRFAVHRFFERIAERTPDAVAVITAEERVTYGELNRRANQLAHYLRSRGAGPEARIGICAGRSSRTVAAILGVLKSGAAYVPLDPAYPKDRLTFMAGDAGLALLLVENQTAETLTEHQAGVVNVEHDWAVVEPCSSRNVDDDPGVGDHLAYIIYTSGSTGKPRGVMVTHANLSHYVHAIAAPIGLTRGDVYLHTASFSFSSSVRQLLVPLSHGSAVFVASSDQIREPRALLDAVKQHAVTIMDLVPAHWRSCTQALAHLDATARAALLDNNLRMILSASEPLLSDLPRIWRRQFASRVKFVNMFGQTETTGIVSCYPLPEEDDDQIRVVSIGRPIANTQVHLLDQSLQPVPVGTPGEICIGGGGVGRGYVNLPALTAERFVRDPFHGAGERRLYKTGDLGRIRPDGNIEFLGRMDQQVKIRGSRVELGEIEAVLAEHPAIGQGIVVARERSAGDFRLVAYLVPTGETIPAADELRSFLKSRLPDHMVPAAFVTMAQLPLTPTGKIDRRALPDADDQRPDFGVPYVRASDPLEDVLVQIWEELLNVRPVGVHDNFFDLGGDSLLAVQMVLRIEEMTGTRLPIGLLFDAASIEHVAAALVNKEKLDFRSPIVTLQSGGSRTPIFFDSGDYHGGGFYCLNLARHLGAAQPFYLLKSHGLDGGHVPRTIEGMAVSYLETLRSFRPNGPYILGGFCNGGLTTFEMARRLQADGQAVELVILIEAGAPNHRLRHLHRMIQRLDSWFSLDPERAIRWHHNLRHYDKRLEDLWQMSSRARWVFMREWIVRRLRGFGPKDAAGPSQASAIQAGSTAIQAPSMADESTGQAYRRAVAGFIPRPYRGRVVLLRAAEAQLSASDDPTMGWSRVAPDCEVHVIPGGHVTALTRHVQSVAEPLRATLATLG